MTDFVDEARAYFELGPPGLWLARHSIGTSQAIPPYLQRPPGCLVSRNESDSSPCPLFRWRLHWICSRMRQGASTFADLQGPLHLPVCCRGPGARHALLPLPIASQVRPSSLCCHAGQWKPLLELPLDGVGGTVKLARPGLVASQLQTSSDGQTCTGRGFHPSLVVTDSPTQSALPLYASCVAWSRTKSLS